MWPKTPTRSAAAPQVTNLTLTEVFLMCFHLSTIKDYAFSLMSISVQFFLYSYVVLLDLCNQVLGVFVTVHLYSYYLKPYLCSCR